MQHVDGLPVQGTRRYAGQEDTPAGGGMYKEYDRSVCLQMVGTTAVCAFRWCLPADGACIHDADGGYDRSVCLQMVGAGPSHHGDRVCL